MYLYILICIIFFINTILYFFSINKEDKIDYYREIPSNEGAAIIGLMVKGNIDGNDIVATLLDLNKKGYVDISYKYVGDTEASILTLTDKERFLTLKDYENYLLDEIFKDSNEVVFDDFVSSDKFSKVFKIFGDMIKKRVSFKKIHKMSHKKNYSKVNFITNYILFSFSFIYPIFYILFKDYLVLALILSYVVGYFFIFFYKIITDDKRYRLDQLILGTSVSISVLVFGLFIALYLVDNLNMEINEYINIVNLVISFITLITMVFVSKNKSKFNIIDIVFILFGIVSLFMYNYVGLSLVIIYLARQIYFNMPEHSNIIENDIDKWFALKKYLDDFTLIKDREAKEVALWDKYLIYGISMGVNKKTIKEYSNMLNLKLINQNFVDKYYVENINY